jgi:nickel-type superoxide dismutase maturation protease
MDPNGVSLPTFARGHSWRGVVRIGVLALVAWAVLARCVHRVEVRGASMEPTLLDGDRLVVVSRPWGDRLRPAAGDVVAVADPRDTGRVLVKRVASVDRVAATLEILGDAPDASTDSRDFGPVPVASVVGRVVHRYGPAGRSGPVGRPTEYHRA